MRKTLIAAVALAPICFAAGVAQATTTINSQSTPVSTATANAGKPDDISIASGATVSASTSGADNAPAAIVTVNSSNSVSNVGTLSSSNINNVVAILINGGNASTVANSTSISLGSGFTAPTTADGYAQGPYAGTNAPGVTGGTGSYGLYGIRLTGTSAYVGSITNVSGGSITLRGNNSYGVLLEAPLTGGFSNGGAISLTGDNGAAIQTSRAASISGDVAISGTVSANGTNSAGVILNGDVGGRVTLNAAINATGYAITSRTSDPTLLAKLQTAANNQINLGGPGLVIAGNVGGGIYFGGAPSGTVAGSTADLTGDGVADALEGTGSVSVFGSAPALRIGSSANNIVVGGFNGLNGATQDNGYGLIIRGSVSASGVYDNISASAVEIGVANAAGRTVSLSSGARIYGTISASSYNADASGLHLFSGANVPTLDVRGAVSASINASTSVVTSSAVQIESGATVNTILNTGSLVAAGNGDNVTAYAVRDKSGTVNYVLNEGVLGASIATTALGDTQTGKAVALDLSQNTTGVTLIQQTNPNPNYAYGDTSGTTHTTTTNNVAVTPVITGDVYLGSGTNTVSLLAGTFTGALAMGSGTGGSLTIDNGASFTGALTYSGSGLAINLANGVLTDRSATTAKLSTLTVGATSTLSFAVDPVNNSATKFVVAGAANIANGAKFDLTLLSTPSLAQQTYTVIQSPSLTVGTPDTTLLASEPFLVAADISTNKAAGTVSVNVRRRTAAEMGLNASEAAILGPVYTAAAKDSEVQAVLLAQTSRTPFLRVYDQLLPESSGAVFEGARQASDAVSRATAAHDQTPGAAGTRAYWGEEFVIGAHGSRTDQNIDYDIAGFGLVGGIAMGGSGLGAFGVTASFATLNITNPLIKGDSQQAMSTLEAGVYWQASVNHLTLDARLGVGADSIDGRRQLYSIGSNGTVAVNRHVKDNRTGYTYTAHIGAGYEQELFGGFYVRPQVRLDYFGMNEDSFKENDTVGQGFALAVSSRSGSVGSASASVVLGRTYGTDFRVRPELEVGVRDAFSGDAGVTTAQFVSGGPSFKLTPSDINGTGGIMRFGVKASTDFYEIGVHAGVEARDKFYSGDARVTVRLLF